MKTVIKVFILLLVLTSCKKDDLEPDCSFPFDSKIYVNNGVYVCAKFKGEEYRIEHYLYRYISDSLAHCQPDQHILRCD